MKQSLRTDILPLVFAAILLGCFYFNSALHISDCDNVANETLLNNTDPNCTYQYIYCNGSDSVYCSDTQNCDTDFNCSDSSTVTNDGSTTSSGLFSSSEDTTTVTSSSYEPPAGDIYASCQRGVTKKFIYPKNCNYYFNCVDGRISVEACPMGFAFNGTVGVCTKNFRGLGGEAGMNCEHF